MTPHPIYRWKITYTVGSWRETSRYAHDESIEIEAPTAADALVLFSVNVKCTDPAFTGPKEISWVVSTPKEATAPPHAVGTGEAPEDLIIGGHF